MNASNAFSATAKAGLNISQADLLALAASDPTAYYALKEEVAKEVANLDAARQRFAEDSAQAQAALTALQSAQEALAAGQAALAVDQAQVLSTREQLAARALDLEQSLATLSEAQSALKQAQDEFAVVHNAFDDQRTMQTNSNRLILDGIAEKENLLTQREEAVSQREKDLESKVAAWYESKQIFVQQISEWKL